MSEFVTKQIVAAQTLVAKLRERTEEGQGMVEYALILAFIAILVIVALKFLQDTGLSRFSPIKPQRWVAASFDHHRGPHGLPHPHVHNIVITALTTGAS